MSDRTADAACSKVSGDVMLVHIRSPVVNVPVLSKATVRHVASASRTRPPLINMPLQYDTCFLTSMSRLNDSPCDDVEL